MVGRGGKGHRSEAGGEGVGKRSSGIHGLVEICKKIETNDVAVMAAMCEMLAASAAAAAAAAGM